MRTPIGADHFGSGECRDAFARSLRRATERMDRDMVAASRVGDPDLDFVDMMTTHYSYLD